MPTLRRNPSGVQKLSEAIFCGCGIYPGRLSALCLSYAQAYALPPETHLQKDRFARFCTPDGIAPPPAGIYKVLSHPPSEPIRSAKIKRSDFLRVRDLSRPPLRPMPVICPSVCVAAGDAPAKRSLRSFLHSGRGALLRLPAPVMPRPEHFPSADFKNPCIFIPECYNRQKIACIVTKSVHMPSHDFTASP